MEESIVYSCDMPYRERLDVRAFTFGSGEPCACIVGSMRGNEVQQLYVASQLVAQLKRIESAGGIAPGKQVMVIPCANSVSLNVGRRFWPVDDTDINRMFPGYDEGETTQRIAAGIFEAVQGYAYGVQYASFYLEGDFLPHVRAMRVCDMPADDADLFGMRYVVVRDPQPFDTTTLNYNWRLWETQAYSLYTEKTDTVDEDSARIATHATLRFLAGIGAIDYPCHPGWHSAHIRESDLLGVLSTRGGFLRRCAHPGDAVREGEALADVLSPLTGETLETLRSPVDGIVFFACRTPLVTEHTLAFELIEAGTDSR